MKERNKKVSLVIKGDVQQDATLHVRGSQLIFNPVTSGNSTIPGMTRAGLEEEFP